MKKQYAITIYALICVIFVLMFQTNMSAIETMMNTTVLINIPLITKTISVNQFFILAFMTGLGFLLGYLVQFMFKNQKDMQAYKKQYEKISVSNEEQNDKVKVLEEKVKSLEIALERALNQ